MTLALASCPRPPDHYTRFARSGRIGIAWEEEKAVGLALPLIRKGLLGDIRINRIEVAAILAVINKPWSRRDLLGTLSASDDQKKTADARAALVETGDEQAQNAVLAWEERNPHENEVGSYLEIGGRYFRNNMAYALQQDRGTQGQATFTRSDDRVDVRQDLGVAPLVWVGYLDADGLGGRCLPEMSFTGLPRRRRGRGKRGCTEPFPRPSAPVQSGCPTGVGGKPLPVGSKGVRNLFRGRPPRFSRAAAPRA